MAINVCITVRFYKREDPETGFMIASIEHELPETPTKEITSELRSILDHFSNLWGLDPGDAEGQMNYTPGPWKVVDAVDYYSIEYKPELKVCRTYGNSLADKEDAQFIASAPTLVTENAALKSRVTELERWCGHIEWMAGGDVSREQMENIRVCAGLLAKGSSPTKEARAALVAEKEVGK